VDSVKTNAIVTFDVEYFSVFGEYLGCDVLESVTRPRENTTMPVITIKKKAVSRSVLLRKETDY
jgi:hypothetical protein